jgi:hypothetical protein
MFWLITLLASSAKWGPAGLGLELLLVQGPDDAVAVWTVVGVVCVAVACAAAGAAQLFGSELWSTYELAVWAAAGVDCDKACVFCATGVFVLVWAWTIAVVTATDIGIPITSAARFERKFSNGLVR